MDRRDFLKKTAFIFTGAIFAPVTGILRPKKAPAVGILPALVGSGGVAAAISWATWTEDSEASLADSDTFVCFFENPTLGGSETGQGGGLTGAHLVLIQVNNVPGVSSGYRQLTTASQQYFEWATAAEDLMIKNKADFTIVLKCKDWATVATANDPIVKFDTSYFFIVSSTSKLRFIYTPTAGGASDVTSTNAVPSSGVVYFAIWRKNGAVKAAFKATTRPTKESDFAAGDTCESTQDGVYDRAFTGHYLFTDTARWATIKAGYLVVAKKALFS